MTLGRIPFSVVERHAAGAVRLGLSLDGLLADSLITRRYGDDRDCVTPTQYLLLCQNTTLAIEDANHGLARVGLGPLNGAIALRMAMTYQNLQQMLEGICRFYASASTALHFKLSSTSRTATLSVWVEARSDQDAAHNEELQLGWLFMICSLFLGYPPPTQVTVRDVKHHNLGQRHWVMGGFVRSGDVTSFSFPIRLLSEPPAQDCVPTLYWECHKHWLDWVDTYAPEAAISHYVNESGFTRFSDMVDASGKSANTIRHRMQVSGGGFREARQRALSKAAAFRLCSCEESVETIAAEFGFSDARSFRRFFKNATGLTPSEVREKDQVDWLDNDAKALVKLKKLSDALSI